MGNNNRRLKILVFAILFVIVIGSLVPSGFVIVGPGLALELDEIVEVKNGFKNSTGDFMLTSISSREASPWQLIFYLLFKPEDYELVNKSLFIPPGMDVEEYVELQEKEMLNSKQTAKYVALKLAGFNPRVKEMGLRIDQIIPDSPAKNILKPGDVIIELNGKEVKDEEQLIGYLQNLKKGEQINLKIRRGKEVKEQRVKTMALGERTALGVHISKVQEFEFPVQIEIKTEKIIGPSAGGMFVLEILNQLIKEDLTGGRKIAGTGTISLDGRLGEIGGVKQKIVSAQRHGAVIFFCPRENYPEAVKQAEKIKVIPVETIFDILKHLGWNSNIENLN